MFANLFDYEWLFPDKSTYFPDEKNSGY